jgi:hypothetical protein
LLTLGAVLSVGGLAAGLIPALAAGVGVPVVPVIPSSTQFDVTGFIQTATLDQTCAAGTGLDAQGKPAAAHCGGTVTVNGQLIVIPSETVVILPAAALTWQELFTHAPVGTPSGQTGMALNELPTKPLTTYEIHVVGNRVIDPNGTNGCATVGGCDRYIAGLVNISQQSLNSGAGYINFIDYTNGVMYVGGRMASAVDGSPILTTTANKGTKVAINDPAVATSGSGGRFSSGAPAGVTQDVRFQVDQDNPTILAETGFPMCLPRTRVDLGVNDALCPQNNRPVMSAAGDSSGITPNPNPIIANQPYELFRMDSPGATACTNPNGTLRPCRDPRQQAPFEVGDYVTFSGSIQADPTGPAGAQLVSAHTIVASVGIYTQPGIDPAYVSVDVSLIGTGGLTVFGAGEAAVRTRFEGMTTDESRLVRLYGIDINPADGSTSDREWGTTQPDAGPPTGAVRGRWRFRPPCTATAGTLTPGKGCTPPPTGQFVPPTREVRAVITGLSQLVPGGTTANPASQIPVDPAPVCLYTNGVKTNTTACTTANGIFYGQYHAPIGEYIFPENVPGTVVPENNFNTIPFLAFGGYQSGTGVKAGVLNPWPSNVPAPLPVCATPTFNGAPYSVANGGSIQLSGSVTAGATTPVTVSWTAGTGLFGTAKGTDLNGALTNPTTTTPTFNATGLAAGTYNVNLSATNPCGTATVSTTITVTAAPVPTINPIQNQTVTAGANVTISATSASIPAPDWTWTQTAGPVNPVAFTQVGKLASASSSIQFSASAVGTYTFSVTAANANGTSSATTVTITATATAATTITFGGTLEYRISKQRLVMTATSTNPAITSMTLLPYLTESGTVFDPTTLGANLTISLITPGSWTITAVGAPAPACNLGGAYATPCSQTPITVKGFTGAALTDTSFPTAMQKIRQ